MKLERLAQDPRVTVRRAGSPDAEGSAVVYWMQRTQRAADNPALSVAIEAANVLKKPVVVFFHLVPRSHHANLRHYQFLVEGLKDIADGLKKRRVGFVIRRHPEHGIVRFCASVRPCLVIGDENPMLEAEHTKAKVVKQLRLPFWSVDADVIVPTRLLGKEHYAARTIRPKIQAQLRRFLTPIENVTAGVLWKPSSKFRSLAPESPLLDGFPVDCSVGPVSGFCGGSTEALKTLDRFIRSRLNGYAKNRNRPELEATSQLSPYLHFGQIGPHTVALAAQRARAPLQDRRAFLEELIVRRELAVNFVRYNADYESLKSCEPWAEKTIEAHARDRRKILYTDKQLKNAETHDPLWNAAQKQMALTGWMHGYLRMYWAKKILEWSPSAADAYEIAVELNDRYELDGRDPNGYAGIAWAIGGKHDRAWGPERQVFGKIRYMSYESTSRKFDSRAYIARIHALEKGKTS